MRPSIEVNGRRIGERHPTYIIAEMSANHNHNFEKAVEIIKAAKEAGADAVKLQTYTPENGLFMSNNGYEFGLALLAASVSLAFSGAGKAALDETLRQKLA